MANEPALPSAGGIVGALQLLYEGLLLRDLFGYALPGATLLTGAMILTLGRNPWQEALWPKVVLLVIVSYVCGVFLRLLGTILRVLVISSDHIGWFGDPWELERGANARRLVNWLWRSKHTPRILEMYKTQLHGDADGTRLANYCRRESLFLHIAGNLGFALLLLWILFLAMLCTLRYNWNAVAVPYAGSLPIWVFAFGLPLLSGALILGHYIHARAFALLLQAADKTHAP